MPERMIEEVVLDLLGVGAAEAEAHIRGDLAEQGADAVLDRGLRQVEAHRHVAAADVEADAGDRHVLGVGDDAAHRLRIAEMAVCAQDAARDAAVLHAARHLRLGALVGLAEDLDLGHGSPPFRIVRNASGEQPIANRGFAIRHSLRAFDITNVQESVGCKVGLVIDRSRQASARRAAWRPRGRG
jgi:hypothetical protein